ncbi:restriction endonuclease subunit S [Streptosporangium sp. NPDC049644]|uniref:restriction endonuclease subunit S n=1 Tax=Streptosporangium sp. NPDC049644 TaxID=3155507 RepID=UPI00343AF411
MSEWRSYTLEELAAPTKSALATGPFGSAISSRYFVESGVPVIRGSNLSVEVGKRLIEDGLTFIEEAKAKEFTRSQAVSGDLVFTCWGTIGQIGFIDNKSKYERYIVSNKQMKMTPNAAIVHPSFLYYALSTPSSISTIQNMAIGSSVPGFNLTQLKQIRVLIPSLREQAGILEVLQALDDKIAINDRISATIEGILSLNFAELGIDVEPDPMNAITASDVIEFNPKLKVSQSANAVYLDMAALSTSMARVSGWTRREPKSGARFSNNDTVMARITPCLENGKTAFVDFLADGDVGIGSTEFIVMRARPGYPAHASYFLARSPRFRENAIRNMVGSSGRQRVAAAALHDFPLTRPNQEELASFGEASAAAFLLLRSLGAECMNLAALRDVLLPKLMMGEIRVRDAEKTVEDAL